MNQMGAGLPAWLTALSWVFIAVALVSAALIVFDIHRRGHRQPKAIMEVVWPLAALYLGPLALPAYARFGRAHSPAWQQRSATAPEQTLTATAVRSGLPGGVSSGLAHIVAVPFVVLTGLTIAGLDMWAMVVIIAVLATALLFAFEYVLLASGQRRRPGIHGVRAAAVVALVTVLAFDVGMLGWMLLLHLTESMPAAGDVRFTFLMQVGLVLGTLTAYPAVRWLAARGAKVAV